MAFPQPNIMALVEQMPATDKELEAQKVPPPGQPTDQAKPKPKPGREFQGSKFTAPDPEAAEKIFDQILAGGSDSLRELVNLIRDPAEPDFKNYKAEYLCHCLVVYVGRESKSALRRMVSDTLTAQVADEKVPLYVRGFLVRELQWIGDRQAVSALGKALADEKLCDDAVRSLLAIGDGAAEPLRNALPAARGRCRLALVQGLAALRDAQSLERLREAVVDAEQDVRLAAVWGLAKMGDAGSVDLLLKTADATAPWERSKATQACLVLAETLAAAGKKTEAARVYMRLRDTRTDPKEQYIREAATKALAGLGGKVA
jgi:HEAT repeat protein